MSETDSAMPKSAVTAFVALPALGAFYLGVETLPWTAANVEEGVIGSTFWAWFISIAVFTVFAMLIRAVWSKNMHPIGPEDALLGFEAAAGISTVSLVFEWADQPVTFDASEPLTVAVALLLASSEGARRIIRNVPIGAIYSTEVQSED